MNIQQLHETASFKLGKRYFYLYNYPAPFCFLSEEEMINFRVRHTQTMRKEDLVIAHSQSPDDDVDFLIVYSTDKKGYYLDNGSRQHFRRPVRLCSNLPELFGQDNFPRLLDDRHSTAYNAYAERVYEQSVVPLTHDVPECVIPRLDLRIVLMQQVRSVLFMNGNGNGVKSNAIFALLDAWKLRRFAREGFLSDYLPDTADFLEMVRQANQENNKYPFYYIEFYPSGSKAVIRSKDLGSRLHGQLLLSGMIYNAMDVPDAVYQELR